MMKSCHNCTAGRAGCFYPIIEKHFDLIEKSRRTLRIKKNHLLFSMGQPLNGWWCIKSGYLRLYRISNQGKEQTFRIVKKGEWLGYREMLQNSETLFNGVTIQECEVCFIPQSLWSQVTSSLQAQSLIIDNLHRELLDAEELIFHLGTKKLHSKLAELILSELCPDTNSVILTREVMGTILGTTTESIVRALSDFRERNWIETDKQAVRISNMKALHEIAQRDSLIL